MIEELGEIGYVVSCVSDLEDLKEIGVNDIIILTSVMYSPSSEVVDKIVNGFVARCGNERVIVLTGSMNESLLNHLSEQGVYVIRKYNYDIIGDINERIKFLLGTVCG
jgi:hypothetical protein